MSQLIDLLHRASQLTEEAYVASAPDGTGLTPRQLLALRFVSDHPLCSQTDIVENTGIDRSTLADIARRLMKGGMIERERSKDDARAYQLKISTSGKRALSASEKAASAVEAAILSKLPVTKQRALVAALHDLIDTLEKPVAVKEAA